MLHTHLSRPARTDDGDTVATPDLKASTRQHVFAAKGFAHVSNFDQHLAEFVVI